VSRYVTFWCLYSITDETTNQHAYGDLQFSNSAHAAGITHYQLNLHRYSSQLTIRLQLTRGWQNCIYSLPIKPTPLTFKSSTEMHYLYMHACTSKYCKAWKTAISYALLECSPDWLILPNTRFTKQKKWQHKQMNNSFKAYIHTLFRQLPLNAWLTEVNKNGQSYAQQDVRSSQTESW
jgi:hypothetical protein